MGYMNNETKEKLETHLWDAKKHLLAVAVTIAMHNGADPQLWLSANACVDVVQDMIKLLQAYDLDAVSA